jgi:hypothetical protein
MTTNNLLPSSPDFDDLLRTTLDLAEPIPEAALSAAYAAIEMRSVSEELANLVFDSLVEAQPVLMRGEEGDTRFATFANEHLTIDLELLGDGQSIVGELRPAAGESIEWESFSGVTRHVVSDQFGRFRITAEPGPVRLRVLGKLVTPWITR